MPTRNVLSLLALLVGAFAITAAQPSMAASPGTTTRVSVASDGTQGNGSSGSAVGISADGRWIAFNSVASNLVTSDSNGTLDVFIHDSLTGATELVSVDSAGNQSAGGGAFDNRPAISSDGRFVAFSFRDLLPGDNNGSSDILVRDRQTGQTTMVSHSDASVANGPSYSPSISADGRFVAFGSRATNLVPGDNNLCGQPPDQFECPDVFVHDRLTGQTERVSVDSAGNEANSNSFAPDISADGRYVAFYSFASNLVAGDVNDALDIFIHDRGTGITERVSVNDAGEAGNGHSVYPRISADGRIVAFASDATNLAPGASDALNIFVHDRKSRTTSHISPTAGGTPESMHLSGNGRFVVYDAQDEAAIGDSNGFADYVVYDRATRKKAVGSLSNAGTPGNQSTGVTTPALSMDGSILAFSSQASNLVDGDTNSCPHYILGNCPDVFVRYFGDSDDDGEWDPFDACPTDADCDDDGFGDGVEMHIGTSPSLACGADAWPPDMDDDGFVDTFDITQLTGRFGLGVPPESPRYDIHRSGSIDTADIAEMTSRFGLSCS